MTEIAKIRGQLKQQENLGVFKTDTGFPILEIQICQSGIALTKLEVHGMITKFLLTDEEAIFLAATIKQLL